MTNPEQIVRALAAADPRECFDCSGDRCCGLCGRAPCLPTEDYHEPDCPWRLAVEWVSAREPREGDEADAPTLYVTLVDAPDRDARPLGWPDDAHAEAVTPTRDSEEDARA